MKTDTPPQPAHGEPWRVYEYNCNTSVVNAAGDEVAVFDSDKDADRAIECVNKLMFHSDLSAVEVHTKETMDAVRAALRSGLKVAEYCNLNATAYIREMNVALAKLNPPQG